jgi:hypothetical protein
VSEEASASPPVVQVGEFGEADFQQVAQATHSTSSRVIQRAYGAALKAIDEGNRDGPEARVYAIMEALFSIGLNADGVGDTWFPMWQVQGRRTSLPHDFAGEQNGAFAALLNYLTYPPLVARIADVVWTNDRKRGDAAHRAIAAYLASAVGLAKGEFVPEFERVGADTLAASQFLARAMQLSAYVTGKTKVDERLKPAWEVVYEAAKAEKGYVPFLKLVGLGADRFRTDLEFAKDAEDLAAKAEPGDYAMAVHKVLKRAAHLYERSGDRDAMIRCLLAAVEQTLLMRKEVQQDSGAEAYWLDLAIGELEEIPGTDERRAAMEVELRGMQKRSLKGMGSFPIELDVTDIREKVIELFADKPLSRCLLMYAQLTNSPDPYLLRKEALESREAAPLMAMMPTSYIDERGRPTKSVDGASASEEPEDDWFWRAIELPERIRRMEAVGGRIEPARQVMMARFQIREDHFASIVGTSPFIAPSQRMIFALGFARLFQGDYISAAHLLIAQIESGVRRVLLGSGHDAMKRRKGEGTFVDMSLSDIFYQMPEAMNAVFTPFLAHEINQLFAKRPGPALRHELAHGKLSDGSCFSHDVIYACWLIFRLACLPIMPVWDKTVDLSLEGVT